MGKAIDNAKNPVIAGLVAGAVAVAAIFAAGDWVYATDKEANECMEKVRHEVLIEIKAVRTLVDAVRLELRDERRVDHAETLERLDRIADRIDRFHGR